MAARVFDSFYNSYKGVRVCTVVYVFCGHTEKERERESEQIFNICIYILYREVYKKSIYAMVVYRYGK